MDYTPPPIKKINNKLNILNKESCGKHAETFFSDYWHMKRPSLSTSQRMGAGVTLSTDIMLEYIFLRIHKVSSNGKQYMHATLYHITGLLA